MTDLAPEQIHALQRVDNGLVAWNGGTYEVGDAFDSLRRTTSTDEQRQAWDTAVQMIFNRAMTAAWIQRDGSTVTLTDQGRQAYISGRVED